MSAPNGRGTCCTSTGIEKLIVVDDAYRCIGLITVKDMDKAESHPLANKDELGRLRVAAATGVGPDGEARARALIAAEIDIIVVDTAHGHSEGVLRAVEAIKKSLQHGAGDRRQRGDARKARGR